MRVRKATVEDLANVALLHRRSILELCNTHYSPEQLTEWTSALKLSSYAKLLASHEMFVADDGEALLGFCVLNANAGFINATYVNPNANSRGVGRALMTAAEAAARNKGLTEIRLHATLNSVGFYERLGYARGESATNRLPSGTELPCVVMSKNLHQQL